MTEPKKLSTQEIQHNKQQSPDPSDYNDEITPEEELINTIRSHDSEEEKLIKIRKLFEKEPKPDINFQDEDNDIPLHIAVRKKELKVIELLVKNGAKADIKSSKDGTSLDIAKRLKRQDILQILEPHIQQISAEEQPTRQERPSEENKLENSDKKSEGSEQQSSGRLKKADNDGVDNDPNQAGSSQKSPFDNRQPESGKKQETKSAPSRNNPLAQPSGSLGGRVERPDNNQESNQQQASPPIKDINVPGDCNSLFWAVVLAYLIPVKGDDEFQNRFEKLFGNGQLDKLQSVKDLIQSYNPSLSSGDIYGTRILKTLIQEFRNKLFEYMGNNENKFGAFNEVSSDYVKRMKEPGTWGSNPEVQAISFMLDSEVSVQSPSGKSEIFSPGNNIHSKIQLFYVIIEKVNKGKTNKLNHYNFVLEQNAIDPVNLQLNSGQQVESRSGMHSLGSGLKSLIQPQKELIEEFLYDENSNEQRTERFKKELKELLEGLPKKHVTPSYDEFLIYSFFGSAVTLPHDIIERVGVKNIYFHLNLENEKSKFIKLLFEINNDTKDKKLVFRTIVVTNVKTTNDQNILNDQHDDDIKEIAKLAGQNVDYDKTDAKILHIKLIKEDKSEKRSFEIIEDQNLKEALKKIPELSLSLLENCSAPKKFEAISNNDRLSTTVEFKNAFEKLSQQTDKVWEGVYKIFEILIRTCRKKDKYFSEVRKEEKGKGVHYKESRFHGFIYGTLILNFKSLYHIDCYAERRSGRGGGPDLIFTSRKDEYINRNLNAVPVIVELKADKDAKTEALTQVKENVFPSLRTFSKEAITAGVSLFSVEKGIHSKWSPLEVEKDNIPNPENFIMLLLNKINTSDLSESIQKELEYLYHSTPAIDRIDNHSNYLSRLILGEVLTSNSGLNKFVFIYEDQDVSKMVTTFLLQKSNQTVVLNIIELGTENESNFELKNAIPIFSNNDVNIEDSSNVYRIDIKVNVRGTDFLSVVSKSRRFAKSSYLQKNIEIKKINSVEDNAVERYKGEFKKIGSVDYITPDEQGKLKIVKKEILTEDLCETLFPLKDLIAVKKEGAIKANINFQAVIQGLFMGKQNIAKENNEIIKVLSETDISLGQVANLVISIADKGGKILKENEAIVISRKEGGRTNRVKELSLRTLIEKMGAKSHTLSFNIQANGKENLILIRDENIYIPHPSFSENIYAVLEYINRGDEKELNDFLKNEDNRKQIMSDEDYSNAAFELTIEREKFGMSDLLLKYATDEKQKCCMLNRADENNITLLQSAAENNKWNRVEYLMNRGVDNDNDYDTLTRYMYRLIEEEEWEKVKFLIEKKQDFVDDNDRKGMTPLHYATRANNEDMVEYLVEKGADVKAKDRKDNSPLHYAARANNEDMVEYLLEKGAIPFENSDGKAPWYYTTDEDVLDVFKKHSEQSESISSSHDGSEDSYSNAESYASSNLTPSDEESHFAQ